MRDRLPKSAQPAVNSMSLTLTVKAVILRRQQKPAIQASMDKRTSMTLLRLWAGGVLQGYVGQLARPHSVYQSKARA